MSKKEKKEKKEKLNKDCRIDVRMTDKDIAGLNILTMVSGKSRSDVIRELVARETKETVKMLLGEE